MVAPHTRELGTEPSFEYSPMPATPIGKKPRPKKSYGGLQSGFSSSPVAGSRSDLTPPKQKRPRAVSAGSGRILRAIPTLGVGDGELSSTRAEPATEDHPKPKPRHRPHTDPETPRSKTATSERLRSPRSISSPLILADERNPYHSVVRLLKDGPKKISEEGTGNYLVILKKRRTDDEDILKIGKSKIINGRMQHIKSKCKYDKLDELFVSYTGELAGIAERLMLAELSDLRLQANCCGTNHRDRFRMADLAIVTEVFHHWLDFCKSAPWDDRGKLKPCWLKRLDKHMQCFDTQRPEVRQNPLRLHWKTFTNVTMRQKMVDNLHTLSRALDVLSWKSIAMTEAIMLGYFAPSSSFRLWWLFGWILLLWWCSPKESFDINELWNIFDLGRAYSLTSYLLYGNTKGKIISEASGISVDSGYSDSHIEVGSTSHGRDVHDETTLDKTVPRNESNRDSDPDVSDREDTEDNNAVCHDDAGSQPGLVNSDETDSVISTIIAERSPKQGNGAGDDPILVLSDSEDDTQSESPSRLPCPLPKDMPIPTCRLDVNSTGMVE